jgi:glycosyltransferase involved in cell wall biosynthesis
VFKSSFPGFPLVTIITAVFNGQDHIEETIMSVLAQTYPNLEYIIIDGGSTDGTIEILKKYDHRLDYWVSEKDKGISSAFNKGIKAAAGIYINFQGDGDGLYEPQALEKIFKGLPENVMLVSGRIQRVDIQGKHLFESPFIPKFKKHSLLFKMSLPHQGLFTHIKFFQEYGLFDEENKYCMDYEHLLRAYKEFPEVVTTKEVVAKWRADGLGNGKTKEILKEYHAIKMKNKVASELVLQLINMWSHFKFGIKRILGKE